MSDEEEELTEAVRIGARLIAEAITAPVSGGTDATGGHVESLSEAVMGITDALVQIASAISELAEAVRARR